MSTPDDTLDQFHWRLIARDLQLRRRADIGDFMLPVDQARLYIHADLPRELACQNAVDPDIPFGNHKGRIVYRIDLTIPQTETSAEQ